MKLVLDYPLKRMLFLKPQSRDEFLALYERLLTEVNNEDMTAISLLVNQLLPQDVKEINIKDTVKMEIENFILYAFSDDKEREQFKKCLKDFMNEVYEEE